MKNLLKNAIFLNVLVFIDLFYKDYYTIISSTQVVSDVMSIKHVTK